MPGLLKSATAERCSCCRKNRGTLVFSSRRGYAGGWRRLDGKRHCMREESAGRLLACAIISPLARDLYSQTIGRFRLPGGTFAPRSIRGPIRQMRPTEKAEVLTWL